MSGNSLEPPESHQLQAVLGWLELGNLREARAEFEQVSPHLCDHPEVLEVRWQLCARGREWAACVEIAQALIDQAPDRPFGWVHRSFALHELKLTERARDGLLGAVDKFPQEWIIQYNLACYSCQLGQLDDARAWLRRALGRCDRRTLLAMATQDQDLEPLWNELEEPPDHE